MNTHNTKLMINFAKRVRTKWEIELFNYLLNHNMEFTGSYRLLAEELTGNYKNASNVRHTAMVLQKKNLVTVDSETGKGDYKTIVRVNPSWINEIIK